MAVFPEVDIPGSYDIAHAVVALDSFDSMHEIAEQASDLYKVGHTVIRAALAAHCMDGRVEAAILGGVGAYEVFGSLVQSADTLSVYYRNDVVYVANGSEGALDTFTSFDAAYKDLTDVPELEAAMRLIVSSGASHQSPELIERGVQGAAMLRTLQLEVDAVMAYRQELAELFNEGV
ncbi:hypothetical protein H7142_01070 [Candidatus Saccharibacteria bacterium]|nr:hypothetical protein [Candidatus Saccharibacteria bacterium]